jgi:TraE protein
VDGQTLIGRLDDLLARNRLLGIALIVMLAWNLINWTAMFRARAETQTVIVPIGGGSGMTIGNGKASEEYLREMARYVTWMVGDFSAISVRTQLLELLRLFPPDRVGEVEGDFIRLADEIERYPSISSIMHWSGDKPLRYTKDLIQVHATKDRLVNGVTTVSKSVFYCIHYRIDAATFWILSVVEKEGTGEDLCLYDGKPAAPAK